jgi:lipopolysaccharide export system protein LptA
MVSPQFFHLRSSAFTSLLKTPGGAVATAVALALAVNAAPASQKVAEAQADTGRALTLRSDIQEANSKTGVLVARGNVQINYPSRQIQATSAQAEYYSRERRIVLSGNVYVLQEGNSLRGEVVTYLIDEGRFVALPQAPKQVEAIYLVPDTTPPSAPAAAPPFADQPQFPAAPGK